MTLPARDTSRATRRDWIGLTVLALPCVLYSMDLTVLNLAVPHLTADLAPTGTQLLWIVDIYGFLVAGSLITMGTLGDRIGRRRLLLIGAAAFGAASIGAAFATTAAMLIAARAVLGVAAATLAPSTLALIRNMFLDPRQRTMAIAVWVASFSAGGAIGPLLGGLLLDHFWWESVFLLNVPVMILLLALGPLLLPEYRDPRPGPLDLLSAALSLVAVLAVIYGVKRIVAGGSVALAVTTIVAGAALAAVFVWRQRALTAPLIDLSLFRSRAFSAALAINILGFFIGFGAFLLIAQYLQLVLGMTPMQAGLWTAPSGVAFIAGSAVAPLLVRRFRVTPVLAGGFVVAGAGFAILTQVVNSSGPLLAVTGYVMLSLGLAPVFTMATDLIVGMAPPERAGMASAISETSSELGGALGIAVLGSFATAVYRRTLTSTVTDGVTPAVAATARETLGSAAAIAATLPEPVGAALLDAARLAFSQAVALTAVVSAALAVLAAITVVIILRDTEPAATT